MAKKKVEQKERTLESFSKEVLIEWINKGAAFKPPIYHLVMLECSIESAKLLKALTELERQMETATGEKLLQLRAEANKLYKRCDQFNKKHQESLEKSPFYKND